jgi:hypothetical protein
MTTPFGKPNRPTNLDSFGEEIDNEETRHEYRRPKTERRTAWVPTLKITDKHVTPVVILDGSYTNQVLDPNTGAPAERKEKFKAYVEHYNSARKGVGAASGICSAGALWRDRREAGKLCGGCHERYANSTWDAAKHRYIDSSPIGAQDKRGLSVLVPVPHYNVPGNRRDNRGGFYNDTLPEYLVTKNDQVRYGGTKVPGLRYALSLSYGSHYSQLFGRNKVKERSSVLHEVHRCCKSCNSRGTITHVGWSCGGCDMPLSFQISDEAGVLITDPTIRELKAHVRTAKWSCEVCNNNTLFVETVRCRKCGDKGQRADILGSVLYLQGIATGAGADGATITSLQLKDWEVFDPTMWAPELLQPLDLDTVFAPAPASRQEQVFGYVPEALQGALKPGAEEYDMNQAIEAEPQVDDNIPFLRGYTLDL